MSEHVNDGFGNVIHKDIIKPEKIPPKPNSNPFKSPLYPPKMEMPKMK